MDILEWPRWVRPHLNITHHPERGKKRMQTVRTPPLLNLVVYDARTKPVLDVGVRKSK
jgi:hypothetical protein